MNGNGFIIKSIMHSLIPNLNNPIEYSIHQQDTIKKVGQEEFDRLSEEEQYDEIQLRYLAKVLVQAYCDMKDLQKRNNSK